MTTEIDMINSEIADLEKEINENESLGSAYRKLNKMRERAIKAELRLKSLSHDTKAPALSVPVIMLLSAMAMAVAYMVFITTAA